jgi:putative restriction endonuclease
VHNTGVRGYVGVTDDQWYHFLAARPEITEVNFWRPKDVRRFGALSGGEPFFFKTHSPQNRIVGGGIFAAFELLPVSLAWEIYREANGVSSLEEMRALITRYRDEPIRPGDDPFIGCILVRDVTFFPESGVMDAPPRFASSIMQGKGYDLFTGPDVRTFPSCWHASCTSRLTPASHGIVPDRFSAIHGWSASGSGSELSRLSCSRPITADVR